jgi:hypothetical protein
MISQPHRAYIYRVATALVPLSVFYGLLASNEAALWLGFLGALLATGTNALAAANTPTQGPTWTDLRGEIAETDPCPRCGGDHDRIDAREPCPTYDAGPPTSWE